VAANDTSKRWRVRPRSELDLGAIDPASKSGAPGDKAATKAATEPLRDELSELQTRLWAESRQALLVVLQAKDAGGKDGVIRKVFSGLNPQGIRVEGFKAPTEEELAHDFLWRVHRRTPRHGEIAIFNRSHYEDVLVVRRRTSPAW
jgi:polyphosphate kinase 2 (PPK2 family)